MIQANELRVGLWFKREIPGRNEAWEDIQIDEGIMYSIFSESLEYALNDLYPIPLTPEILERAGFVKTEHKLPLLTYYDYRLGNCVASVIPSGIEIEFCGLDIEERTYITKVNHIHQLQNLYFALTGTELTIKL